MAGNQAVFDAAMRRAQGYAYENQWDRALKEYQRALAEFPNDVQARTNYAQALYRLQQFPQALEEYTLLLKLRPNDAFLLNRLAEISQGLGRKADAQQYYALLAQVYVSQNQPREAIATFKALLEMDPTRRDARERMVELYKTVGDRTAAINEYIVLSRIAVEGPPEDLAGAVKYAEAAFALDSTHRDAREWLYKLRRRQAEVAGTSFDEKTLRVTGDRAQTLDARDLNEMLALAMSYQERGQYAVALKQYEAVLGAGLRTPAVYYNLGLLYQQAGQFADAVDNFRRAADDAEYGMSSSYSLGQCYRELGQLPEATQSFEAALRQVDLQSITKNELPDLVELYQAAADAHQATGNQARAASLYTGLVGFLQTRRWRTGRTAELKQRAESLTEQSMRQRLGGDAQAARVAPAPVPAAPPAEPPPFAARPTPTEEPSIYMRPGGPAGILGRNPSGILRPITDFLKPAPSRPPPSYESPRPPPPEGAPAPADSPRPPEVRARTTAASGAVTQEPTLPPARNELLATVAAAPLPTIRPLSTAPVASNGPRLAPIGPVTAAPGGVISSNVPVPSYTGNPALDQAIEEAISDSDEYMVNGLLFAATDACFEVIRLAPDFLPIHLRLAEIYRLRHRPEEAAAKLQAVIDLYLVRSEPHLAVQVYPALIDLQPHDTHLRTKFATLLLDLGQRDEVIVQYLSLADMLFETGHPERAVEELRRVRSLDPQNIEVRLRQGTYLLRSGRVEEALVEFGRILQADSDNLLALVRVYVTLVLLDKDTQWDALQSVLGQARAGAAQHETIGEEIFAQAQQAERPALFYAMGLIYDLEQPGDMTDPADEEEFRTLRLRGMREMFERALELLPPGDRSPLAVVLRWRAAAVARQQRDGDAAVQYYREVMALLENPALLPSPRPTLDFIKLPTRVQVYQPLAEALALQGDTNQAIEMLQVAKTHVPYDREIYTKLAELYFRKGQLGAALVAMEELVNHYQETFQIDKMLEALGYMARLAPNNIPVRRKLADIYLKRGMIDQGLSELDLLSSLQRKEGLIKDAVSSLQRASDIYWTMGQHAQALALYDRILRMAPGDIDVRLQLINLYIQMGRLGDSVREQKALAEICLAQNQPQAAEAALHQLIALAPADPEGYYMLAELLASEQKYDQAARLYGRLRRMQPDKDDLAALQAAMQRQAEAQTKQ